MVDLWNVALLAGAVFCSYRWGRSVEKEWWHDRFRLAGGSLTLTKTEEEKK